MTSWKMITIPKDIHAKLMTLKGVLELRSIGAVIDSLMKSRQYNDEFFEKLKGLI